MKSTKLNMRFVYTFVCLCLLSSSVFADDKRKVSFSLMTYNLENLFDTKKDKGKSDWTWLPLAFKNSSPQVQAYCHSLSNDFYRKNCLELDWSQTVMDQKIKNLAKVILAYNSGQGADIVVFQEVENINALKQLVNKGLRKKGYRYYSFVEGPDSRGIDVALISKYPVTKTKYHTVNLAPYSTRSTRGILETRVRIRKKYVTVFTNHWPSQGNIDETRELASLVLKKAALKVKSGLVIATGDFNTKSDDMPHGLNNNIMPYFEDVEMKARTVTNVKAKGTHWYKGEWESLDKILVLKSSLSKTRKVDHKSFEILFHPFMVQDLEWEDWDTGEVHFSNDVPVRFEAQTGMGYSDHLPVAVGFTL